MFKNCLRARPLRVQLLVFLSFWCVLILLGLFLQPLYIKAATGVGTDQLKAFLEKDIFEYPHVIFLSNAIYEVITFLLPVLIYAYLADPQPKRYLGLTGPSRPIHILWITLLAISMIFVITPLGLWLKQIDIGAASRALDEQRERMIMTYLNSGNAWSLVRSIFLIAVIPACCEELFFRGMIMKFAKSLFKKWWLSITVSALLFAAFHTTISEFIPIFIAGIILGWVYYLTSSIWMNILLHFLFNGLQVVVGMYSNPGLEKALQQPANLLSVFGIAVLLTAAGIYLLSRSRTPLPDTWSVVPAAHKQIGNRELPD